eukprot:CAMPEP_0182422536 /NCGR_PEP_ID=MMETSP1167-20130531/8274_1 /TAXON_ID=2988 /ORGANISM="Mallomonas Sp, Strain CCMP3275" /LENGTH=251 /DNA_ID=CAMNT_0024600695 /DNA_START=147 /DNA_END=899 /DNA_ORIENTATION=+
MSSSDDDTSVNLALELSKKFNELQRDVETKQVADASELFDELFEEFPITYGKAVSRKEREENSYVSTTLVYGEISFEPFAQLFHSLYAYGLPEDGGKFVDIGCGTGKPVLAATLLHDFETCIGIEILAGLHSICLKVLQTWRRTTRHRCSRTKFDTDLQFLHADATASTIHPLWSDADLVFANSTCFDAALMCKLATCAENMRQGALFVTTTKKLPTDQFETLEVTKMCETWGDATVFIQRKITEKPKLTS